MSYQHAPRRCAERPNGDRPCVAKARSLFRRFHCYAAPKIERQPCKRIIPRVLVRLGNLRGLIYSSDRAQCGRPRTFIHFMESPPPMLACDPQGEQLFILGGRYRVTRNGIEG